MNVFCSRGKFLQKTSFFKFFFGVGFNVSFSHLGFYWFLSFFVLVGAISLNVALLVAFETFHLVAPVCGFFFCTGHSSSSSLLPIIGSGSISTRVHCVRIWSRHFDSQDSSQ